MSPLISAIVAVVNEKREQYVAAASAVSDDVHFEHQKNDMAQLLEGFFQVLLEVLEGTGTTKRKFFLEGVMTAVMRQSKNGFIDLIESSTKFCVPFIYDVVIALEPEHRQEASVRLGDFLASYLSDLARLGLKLQS